MERTDINVSIPGSQEETGWKQEADGLQFRCPDLDSLQFALIPRNVTK